MRSAPCAFGDHDHCNDGAAINCDCPHHRASRLEASWAADLERAAGVLGATDPGCPVGACHFHPSSFPRSLPS